MFVVQQTINELGRGTEQAHIIYGRLQAFGVSCRNLAGAGSTPHHIGLSRGRFGFTACPVSCITGKTQRPETPTCGVKRIHIAKMGVARYLAALRSGASSPCSRPVSIAKMEADLEFCFSQLLFPKTASLQRFFEFDQPSSRELNTTTHHYHALNFRPYRSYK